MDNEKDDRQTVGAQIPGRLYQVINLYKLAHGSSKSQIIRDGILLWIDQNNIDINELIEVLSRQIQAAWVKMKNKKDGPSFDQFIGQQHEILQRKGVDSKVRKRILDNIKK